MKQNAKPQSVSLPSSTFLTETAMDLTFEISNDPP